MSVSQLEVPVRLARWRRLCLSSFVLAGITALILWAALDDLLTQGGLGTVLSAGRAELAAPLLSRWWWRRGCASGYGQPNAVRCWPAVMSRTRAIWPCTPSW